MNKISQKIVNTLKVGSMCNSRCKICCYDNTLYTGCYSLGLLLNDILRKRKKCRHIQILGGEPTIRKDIFAIVSYAKRIGFNTIEIMSNGSMFYYPEFCKKIIKAGANRFFISILGANRATHDFLTSRKGSFFHVIRSIKNLKRMKQLVHSNFVFTKINFKEAPKVTKLLLKLGVDIIRFSALKVDGEAKKNEDIIDIKMSDYADYLKQSLKLVAGHKIPYDTEGIPFCFIYNLDLGKNAKYISRSFSENIYSDGKVKRQECKACSAFAKCLGPWEEYVGKFGWTEFQAV